MIKKPFVYPSINKSIFYDLIKQQTSDAEKIKQFKNQYFNDWNVSSFVSKPIKNAFEFS